MAQSRHLLVAARSAADVNQPLTSAEVSFCGVIISFARTYFEKKVDEQLKSEKQKVGGENHD